MLKESPERVTTKQLEQKTAEVPQEQIVKTTPTTQQVTDQRATIEQLQPRAQLSTREKSDTNVNTELSAVVNHLAKLNDSGVDKVMTDRERRAVEIAKKKLTFRLRASSDDSPRSCTESESRDEKMWVRNSRMKKRRKRSRRPTMTTHSRADRRYDSLVKVIPRERASERIVKKIVGVAQIITQERVQNRTVKQIVEVVHSIPMEVEHAQMERKRETTRRTDHRRAKKQ